MEVQADPVGPGLGAGEGIGHRGQAADLDPGFSMRGHTPSLPILRTSIDQTALNFDSVLTPTRLSTFCPPLKIKTVGIAEMRHSAGVS